MCAGAGGQALGLHNAGFIHSVLVELDHHACETLRLNNHQLQLGWGEILETDLKQFAEQEAGRYFGQIELVAGGVPCPPFSKAGQQLGPDDERDLFPTALKIVAAVRPYAVMLENVSGLLDQKFDAYRHQLEAELLRLGYESRWKLLQAADFGVPQLRPRVILVAMPARLMKHFQWPEPTVSTPVSVGEALFDLMAARGWPGADAWKDKACSIAPTLVGGSKKHGGPDLGPTRAKRQWQALGVNGHRVGDPDELPSPDFVGVLGRDGSIRPGFEHMPLLNVRMAARIQGFPDHWQFFGSKTHAYRQVGNAFPPPVAEAVGKQIMKALKTGLRKGSKVA